MELPNIREITQQKYWHFNPSKNYEFYLGKKIYICTKWDDPNKLNMKKIYVFRLINLMSLVINFKLMLAQNSINGTIIDIEDGVAIPGASVFILRNTNGNANDVDGNFTIKTSRDLPIEIEVMSLG